MMKPIPTFYFFITLLYFISFSNRVLCQLASWSFDASTLVATQSDMNLTASDVNPVGLGNIDDYNASQCPSNAWNPSGWSEASTVDINIDYAEFTITADAGCTMDITGFTFAARRTSFGPKNYEVRSSNDTYSSTLLSGDINDLNCDSEGGTFTTINVSAGGNISFRLYGINATSPNGRMRMDDVVINGSTSCPLPVELRMFDVAQNLQTNILIWETASETNNDYFVIENSTDDVVFRELSRIDGMGNTNQEQFYSFTHNTPPPGTNYYRLKQVDFDGSFSYSKTISIDVRKEGAVQIYPTVAKNRVGLHFPETGLPQGIAVYDVSGKEVFRSETMPWTTFYEMDVSRLAGGHYFVKVFSGQAVVTKRFVKQ